MAPLDILFNANGTVAYVTFHGSWDRTAPIGYKLAAIQFDADAGQPIEPADSTTAATAIISNADNNARCPDECFRPVGLAWDSQGRLFMSSDATGEIYVLQQQNDTGTGSEGTPMSSASGTLVTSTATSSSSSNMGSRSGRSGLDSEAWLMTGVVVVLSVMGGSLLLI